MPVCQEISGHHLIEVRFEGTSCEVWVGSGLLVSLGSLLKERVPGLGKRCALITDSNVAPLYAADVIQSLEDEGFKPVLLRITAGEASKSMEEVTRLCREMLRAGLDRKSFVVALGGGVVGDLAGFCSAIFQRGIPCIQVPTTIVSQVDSSVGGKTGVNTPEGKNLLGAFHQPRLVLADVDTLGSLPVREYAEGFAEIIKHSAIRDATILPQLPRFRDSSADIAPLIARNVAIKAAVVEEDETEVTGTRALLNFGHTIGHGIEAAAGYGELLHGEAISLGMVAALRLSESLAKLSSQDSKLVRDALGAFALPLTLPARIPVDRVMECLSRDKKFVNGQIRFVLLRALGDAFVSPDVTLTQIRDQVDRLRAAG